MGDRPILGGLSRDRLHVFYLILFRVSTPANVWKAAQHFGSRAEKIYYGYLVIKPYLVPVASESALLMLVAAVVPYGSVYILDLWHRYRIKRNARAVSG